MSEFETDAMVHSLGAIAKVVISEKIGDNLYRARFEGKDYTAIYNLFSGMYYVDDLYGALPEA